MSSVVVVESPAKAETINKYLGKDYTVLASYGHIRDLPSKNGSVDPDNNFAMVWNMDGRSEKRVKEIVSAVKKADGVILATDPDREGEAISWHVHEVLKEKNALKDKPVTRVVFNEITKSAILKAMDNPREIDSALVNAYMARRALDYLVGFTLSPILWRKLPGSRSAGRVQSVALRLICERESEIEKFIPQEYWSVQTKLETANNESFLANLTHLNGEKLDRLSIKDKAMADSAVALIKDRKFSVKSIEQKSVQRNPYPPFITSTLQQDASRKLRFSATRTMQLAQRLYEGIKLGGETVGLITYMRTDGVNLSQEAVSAMRGHIKSNYGDKYLPDAPKVYKSKAKNAQEAHEAIRPTDINRRPEDVKSYLDEDQFKLYELIWKRTLACQMSNAIFDQVRADIIPTDHDKVTLRATGSVMVFDGFLSLYKETTDEDDSSSNEEDRRLPRLEENQQLNFLDVIPDQHFTKPPPRFTEASLVKILEELGIGRPSTYASIIRLLQDRNYVTMDARRFIPEDRGRLVTTFLTEFFPQYVEYSFTAELEEKLDEISANSLDWQKVLTEFWKDFSSTVDGTKDLTITQVIDVLDEALGSHFFPETEDGKDPRECPNDEGRLGIKIGRFGAFIGCSNYPECKYTRQFKLPEEGDDGDLFANGPVELGECPETNKMVSLQKGPYGVYVQLGEEEEIPIPEGSRAKKPKKKKPKRASLTKDIVPSEITLEQALKLLQLPRDLGVNPENGEPVSAGLGRFGPFVKMGDDLYVSLKEDKPEDITLERAIEVIKASGKRVLNLGLHKKKPVKIKKGRFGYYIAYGRMQVALPKDSDPDAVTLEQAIERIDAKIEREKGGKTPAKKAPAKKKTTKAKK